MKKRHFPMIIVYSIAIFLFFPYTTNAAGGDPIQNRETTTRINLEDLDKYINEFKEKKIYGELQSNSKKMASICAAIDQEVNSGFQPDISNYLYAQRLAHEIEINSTQCSKAISWPAEIASFQLQAKSLEDKVIQGLEAAQATVAKCGSMEDATRIKKLFDEATALAAKVKGHSIVVTEKNAKINEAIKNKNDAIAAFATLQQLVGGLSEQYAKSAAFKVKMIQRISATSEPQKAYAKKADEILNEIDRLRLAFPEKLYEPDEKKFNDLKSMVERYRSSGCEPDAPRWTAMMDDMIKNVDYYVKRARENVDKAINSVDACKDLTSADKDTNSINASANWVLTAIQINQDLPRKAEQCIAAIKGKKDKQVAATKCWPGSGPYWDDTTNSVRCRCKNGLKWNDARNACIVDKEAQLAAANCSNHPNSRPYWDDKTNQVRCSWCNPGYKWRDATGLECVKEKNDLVSKKDCSKYPNSRPYWDNKTNQMECRWCNPGYQWSSATSTECVPDRATQLANADCSNTPNSRPYWDDKRNEVRCGFCNPGYHFKYSTGVECVADNAGPNFDDLNVVNVLQNVAQQINNANQNNQNQRTNTNNQRNENRRNPDRQPQPAQTRPKPPAHNHFCGAYAGKAVKQYQESVSRRCGYSDRRWQKNYDNHYTWCTTVSKASAESETRAREKGLRDCVLRSGREPR